MEELDSWKEEKRSSYLYKEISKLETNLVHKKLFKELSGLAEKQAHIWEGKLKEANITIPEDYKPDLKSRFVIWLVKCFGARSLRSALAALKIRGMSIYQTIPHTTEDSDPKELIESQHENISRGNNIRAAVFGINDGLVSNTSLILGIAGASAGSNIILLTGVAGLIAGACSMAAGEYVSVRSQREMLEYQLELEKSELELYPEEEAEELAIIYEARGVPREEAVKVANTLIKDPVRALDTLAREELGINPSDMISPWGASISSFISFAIGAFIPLVPFVFGGGQESLKYTLILSGITLFVVGASLSIFTQKNAFLSGLRMLLIGAAAGAITYFIGSLLGVDNL